MEAVFGIIGIAAIVAVRIMTLNDYAKAYKRRRELDRQIEAWNSDAKINNNNNQINK